VKRCADRVFSIMDHRLRGTVAPPSAISFVQATVTRLIPCEDIRCGSLRHVTSQQLTNNRQPTLARYKSRLCNTFSSRIVMKFIIRGLSCIRWLENRNKISPVQTMMSYGKVKVLLHSFVTSALERVWSAKCCDRFDP
jgi:hypothetical protein